MLANHSTGGWKCQKAASQKTFEKSVAKVWACDSTYTAENCLNICIYNVYNTNTKTYY